MPPELLNSRSGFIAVGCMLAYIAFMVANPARGSLRDGARCLQRYPRLWSVLAVFGFSYAAFQLAVNWGLYHLLPEGAPGRPLFQWERAWLFSSTALSDGMSAAVLPALEMVAGIFNILVTTFPFSALAGLLFLSNWGNHRFVFARALSRRFGAFGHVVMGATILCALAALVKPFDYALLPVLSQKFSPILLLQSSLVIDWLSFLFESLFGVCVQIYLILLAYVWVRGLNFTHEHLLDFAIRRFSNVIKWALVIMLISTACIHLPLIWSSLPFGSSFSTRDVFDFNHFSVRPLLAGVLIAFSLMQIDLIFHGETLRQAFNNHVHFVIENFGRVFGFLVAAILNAWLLASADQIISSAVGSGTVVGIGWRLLFPLLAALLGAWLLASWACLYLRAQRGRAENEPLVRF